MYLNKPMWLCWYMSSILHAHGYLANYVVTTMRLENLNNW